MKQKKLFIAAVVTLLVAFVVGMLWYTTRKKEQSAQQPPVANSEALVRAHSPSIGKSDAPVVIVEFFDPACETCATFYPRVKELVAENSDRILFVMRYTPFHEGSDRVVALLEAARKQGKFWPTLEAVLQSQASWAPHHTAQVELVFPHIEGLGLDLERLKADMGAPEIRNLIIQDVTDARTLNVSKTPEFFVNGRPLPSFGFEQLKALVDDALEESR